MLHFSYEKAGLTIQNQPIPWNAEAVLVEAIVQLAAITAEARGEFQLRLQGSEPIRAESLRPSEIRGQARVFFRIAVPSRTQEVEFFWRDTPLGRITLPFLSRADFLQTLRFEDPTLHARLADETRPCQSYVKGQTKELFASVIVSAPTCLAPLADFDLAVDMIGAADLIEDGFMMRLGSRQLTERKAVLLGALRKPRTVGQRQIRWRLDDEPCATIRVRGVSPIAFRRSLRVSTTRFFLEGREGLLPLARYVPENLGDIRRLGPVFLVCSGIAGMAANVSFAIRALDERRQVLVEIPGQEIVVTDGPTVVALGTFEGAELERVRTFELLADGKPLGSMSIGPMPTAAFTSEGGFAAFQNDVAWSPDAEDQLRKRLGELLG